MTDYLGNTSKEPNRNSRSENEMSEMKKLLKSILEVGEEGLI